MRWPPGGVTAMETSPGRYTVDGKLEAAAVATAVLGWFAARGVTVTGVQTDRRTLEDVFLTQTRERDVS